VTGHGGGRDLLVGVDVGTTRVKAVLVDTAGRELADAAEPTPWQRGPQGSELDPGILAELVRTLVCRAGDAAARAGGVVVGIGATGMGEAGVAVDADGWPLAPIRAWFDQRADVDAVREACGDDAFHRAVGMRLDAQPSLPKLLRMRVEHPALARVHRFYSVPEYAVVALGGLPGSEVSLASRTGLLDVCTGRSWPVAVDLLGADLLGEPVLAGAPAGHAGTGVPPAVRGAVLTVAGHDHQTAGMVAGAARDGMLFDSLGTAEGLLRFARLVPTPDLAAAAVAAGLTLGRTVVADHACLLAGLFTGFGLERVAGALGATTRAERAVLGEDALGRAGRRLARVRVAAESVVLELADGVTPGEVWRSAVGDLVDASREAVDQMARLVGPHTGAVGCGGWLANPMVRHAKAAQLPGLRVVGLTEAGAAGAADFAGVAAGVLPPPAALDGPPWPVGDDPADEVYGSMLVPEREVP
jgi:sugar (pentulose or hexulose) kinase